MAQQGAWVEAGQAEDLIQKVWEFIKRKNTKFDLLGNDHENVVSEPEDSEDFARNAAEEQAKFNFFIVM